MNTNLTIGSVAIWRTREVTIVAIDGDNICVYDASSPNPMGIPGIGNFWTKRALVQPQTDLERFEPLYT